ncbi:hypothetical protein TNIN_98321, partial [Trichonephila inaurata madagascariensis]
MVFIDFALRVMTLRVVTLQVCSLSLSLIDVLLIDTYSWKRKYQYKIIKYRMNSHAHPLFRVLHDAVRLCRVLHD